jgi:hypothetical protein
VTNTAVPRISKVFLTKLQLKIASWGKNKLIKDLILEKLAPQELYWQINLHFFLFKNNVFLDGRLKP